MSDLLVSTPEKIEPTFTPDRIKSEQKKIEKEVARRRWAYDPGSWLVERLGQHGWSKQIEIMEVITN